MKVNAPDIGATPLTRKAIADAAAALKARQEAAAKAAAKAAATNK